VRSHTEEGLVKQPAVRPRISRQRTDSVAAKPLRAPGLTKFPSSSYTMDSCSLYTQYKELSRVTHVSETVLRREVDIDLLDEHLNMNTDPPPTQQEQTSYAVYILQDMRELPAGDYATWDNGDFKGWKIQDFDNLPRAIRRELLLALAEHGFYPVGKTNRTQAEKLEDIANSTNTRGLLRERRGERAGRQVSTWRLLIHQVHR
jgi:hypothetical protein